MYKLRIIFEDRSEEEHESESEASIGGKIGNVIDDCTHWLLYKDGKLVAKYDYRGID
ncbi:hypothetical protein [uncultured Sulfitobacter sp.]|uniref:hypothetical protein n=1 Tax=uncultured Sulfitobacter sp. TaxID=191468 RepID=UPI0025991AD7|nr:hypothetical protein [uncultured Sulfitobacter sp.]